MTHVIPCGQIGPGGGTAGSGNRCGRTLGSGGNRAGQLGGGG